jgi:hypothetical protein
MHMHETHTVNGRFTRVEQNGPRKGDLSASGVPWWGGVGGLRKPLYNPFRVTIQGTSNPRVSVVTSALPQ